jgi:hypothetical protein
MLDEGTYGLSVTVDATLEVAEKEVREALAGEGFGNITEIDVAATSRKSLAWTGPLQDSRGLQSSPR